MALLNRVRIVPREVSSFLLLSGLLIFFSLRPDRAPFPVTVESWDDRRSLCRDTTSLKCCFNTFSSTTWASSVKRWSLLSKSSSTSSAQDEAVPVDVKDVEDKDLFKAGADKVDTEEEDLCTVGQASSENDL